MNLAHAGVAGFLLGAAGAWLVHRVGPRLRLVDTPTARSSHRNPTPKGGGIGILAAFVWGASFGLPAAFWLPAAGLAGVSLLGDRVHLSQWLRLVLQLLAAGCMTGVAMSEHGIAPSLLAAALWGGGVLFVVATANWFNFMDGINGIAGITGALALLAVAAYAWLFKDADGYARMAVIMGVSCLGFLPFNVPRARVFMGDVGSILLGLVFAALVVRLTDSILDFVCLLGFLFVFYADEFWTMAIRLRARENLLLPHRRHIYQILANQMGIAHWKVSVSYGLVQLGIIGGVLGLRRMGAVWVILFLGALLALVGVGAKYVRQRE